MKGPVADMSDSPSDFRQANWMIRSVAEFVKLRNSEVAEEQTRASVEDANEGVWLGVIKYHPELRKWVAHNKTVPMSIIGLLVDDVDPVTRTWVAQKRKLDRAMFVALAADPDAGVRHALASNAKLPPDLLRKLAEDPIELVASTATERLQKRKSQNETVVTDESAF
jgi:hypothetical protein